MPRSAIARLTYIGGNRSTSSRPWACKNRVPRSVWIEQRSPVPQSPRPARERSWQRLPPRPERRIDRSAASSRVMIRSNRGWSASHGLADEGAFGRRELAANWSAGLQRADFVVIISIALALIVERPCVRFLSAPQPVLSRKSQAFVQLCSIAHSREMGAWRATTLTLERWGESVCTEDAAHAEEFGTKGDGNGAATGRDARQHAPLRARAAKISAIERICSVPPTGSVRYRGSSGSRWPNGHPWFG